MHDFYILPKSSWWMLSYKPRIMVLRAIPGSINSEYIIRFKNKCKQRSENSVTFFQQCNQTLAPEPVCSLNATKNKKCHEIVNVSFMTRLLSLCGKLREPHVFDMIFPTLQLHGMQLFCKCKYIYCYWRPFKGDFKIG